MTIDLARYGRSSGFYLPASTVLHAKLVADGRPDWRRIHVPTVPGDLMQAGDAHAILAVGQEWFEAVALAEHWSLEIWDPATGWLKHIERGRQTSTTWVGDA